MEQVSFLLPVLQDSSLFQKPIFAEVLSDIEEDLVSLPHVLKNILDSVKNKVAATTKPFTRNQMLSEPRRCQETIR